LFSFFLSQQISSSIKASDLEAAGWLAGCNFARHNNFYVSDTPWRLHVLCAKMKANISGNLIVRGKNVE
jgi:hypothetical protein